MNDSGIPNIIVGIVAAAIISVFIVAAVLLGSILS
jgi:hypothetical protein